MANPIDPYTTRRRLSDAAGAPIADSPEELPATDQETAARAARAVAWIRYEAFSSSTPDDLSIDCGESSNEHDFDHCGTVRVAAPVLFHAESASVPAASMADVRQGQLGDCALMAVLAGLASKPEGRALLRSLIVENRDGNGHVVSYTVSLRKPILMPFGPIGTFSIFSVKTKLNVLPEYPKEHAKPGLAGNEPVVWPMVVEKAFAQLFGGYNVIAPKGWVELALEALTGDGGEQIDFKKDRDPAREVLQGLAAGKIVILKTPPDFSAEDAEASGLVGDHAYLAAALENGRFVRLYNPWGPESLQPVMPVDALQRWFSEGVVGSVKGDVHP